MRIDLDVDERALDIVTQVTEDIHRSAPEIGLDAFMLVGARCRDLWHVSCGGRPSDLRGTKDVDLALATSSWDVHGLLAERFERTPASNAIQYRIGGLPVDVMPFGGVEDPTGSVTPPPRGEALSVWGFQEVYDDATTVPHSELRIPTIPGFTALKVCAWLDRSEYGETKDAGDIAVAVHWYERVVGVDTLWDVASDILAAQDYDQRRSAAHLLGRHTRALLGDERTGELLARWTLEAQQELSIHLKADFDASWPTAATRHREIVAALTAGLRGE